MYCPLHTARLILQAFRHFIYVTAHFTTLPLLHLRHSSFYNPSLASSKSQALHLTHVASRTRIQCVLFKGLFEGQRRPHGASG